jgi:hypothetical protein
MSDWGQARRCRLHPPNARFASIAGVLPPRCGELAVWAESEAHKTAPYYAKRVTLSLRLRVFVLVPTTFSTQTVVAVGEGVEQRESAGRSRLAATTFWRNITRRLLEVGTSEAAEGR